MDSGIPTDKDQYSELDVQDQKEISDFQRQVDGRLDMLMLGSPTTYAKRLIGCAGGRGGHNLCEKKYGDRWPLFHKNSQIG